jgi:chemotaxis protein methyltransferase CheR
MALIEQAGTDQPAVGILATDINEDALAVAQRGEYGEAVLQNLEVGRRSRFFARSGAVPRWSVVPAVRRQVAFRVLNLAEKSWRVEGPFDVILCRNVLMYLGIAHRCAVLERMGSLLSPDGLVILDPVEHPGPAGSLFACVGDGVYSLRAQSPHALASGRASPQRIQVSSL